MNHDDCQDALAEAVRPEWSRWVWILRIAAQSHKERLLDDELQKFARSVLGYDATGSTWFRSEEGAGSGRPKFLYARDKGLEMPDISDIPFGLIGKAYTLYKDRKLDSAIERLRQEGVTVEELKKNDYRFSAFMRMADALDTCSSNQMMNFLVDYLIAGVATSSIDDKPDLYQSVLSNLGKLTEIEVEILGRMREKNMREGTSADAFVKGAELEIWVAERVGISEDAAQALIVGIGRSGFTQSRHSSFCDLGRRSTMSHRLTDMADMLLDLVYERTRL